MKTDPKSSYLAPDYIFAPSYGTSKSTTIRAEESAFSSNQPSSLEDLKTQSIQLNQAIGSGSSPKTAKKSTYKELKNFMILSQPLQISDAMRQAFPNLSEEELQKKEMNDFVTTLLEGRAWDSY